MVDSKKNKIYVFGGVLIVIISLLVFNIFRGKKVVGLKVEKKTYVEKILVTGTVQGKNYSKLAFEFSGTVSEIYKREGELVKKGERIAKLNSDEIEKNISEKKFLYEKANSDLERLSKEELQNAKSVLSSSEISYLTSKSEFEKYSQLYEKKYINQLEYNNKKNQYFTSKNLWEQSKIQLESLQLGGSLQKGSVASLESVKESLEALEKRMEKYLITAPFDGYITKREVEVGETVAPYSEMFQFSSQEEKVVLIDLDEKYASRVNVGNILKIYPYGNIEDYSLGKIYFKGIDIDSQNGTLEIKTTIEKQLPEFLYNSTVNGVVEGREIRDGFLLEERFIVYRSDKRFVFILESGKSALQEIQGVSVIDGFIVTKGLEIDEIVLEPKELEDGMKVKVKN